MVALVTGGGRGADGGMGAAICRVFGQAGARVAVNDVTAEATEATVRQLEAMGAEAIGLVGDVSNRQSAESLVARTVERFGRIDILVNNAGIGGRRAPVVELRDEDWEAVLAVNLHGPFFLARAAIPHMRQQRFGRIINIASLAALRVSLLGGAQYTASKEALWGFTRHLAVEVTQHGITVNAIMPGYTLTPLVMAHTSPEARDRIAQGIPSLRGATPEEIAYVALFLASREAGQVSGVAIPVDGAVSVLPGDITKRRQILGG
ncbi:MAG: SDR family oxidoreductase [Firmicutes bacterium]|nr:SDR family oxidoreductase [Alicyclobacillaceae bacterium]MCL6497542.1 SDR family oxidoreductase [Bacillota bacterium]